VSTPLPLAEASRRLRRPPGRPRRLGTMATPGVPIQGAGPEPAPAAALGPHFAATVPRWLPIQITRTRRREGQDPPVTVYPASEYSGIPVRALWRFIAAGQLHPVKLPGVRRLIIDKCDLDRLNEEHRQ